MKNKNSHFVNQSRFRFLIFACVAFWSFIPAPVFASSMNQEKTAEQVKSADPFVAKFMTKSFSYLKKRKFNPNTYRSARPLAEQRLVKQVSLSYWANSGTKTADESTMDTVSKVGGQVIDLQKSPSAGVMLGKAGTKMMDDAGQKLESMKETTTYNGSFECVPGTPISLETKTSSANDKWRDFIFTCGNAKVPFTTRKLIITIDPLLLGEKDRDSLKLTTCVSQLNQGYFRVNFWGPYYACSGSENRSAYFMARSPQFMKRFERSIPVDKENRVDLFNVEIQHASGNAEWKFAKGYEETYWNYIIDTIQHPDEKYQRDLAFFMSRDPKSIPGLEFALQISTNMQFPVAANNPCANWDSPTGLIKTIYHNGGSVKKWSYDQIIDPNLRTKALETFYPVTRGNESSYTLDFTNIYQKSQFDSAPLSTMTKPPANYFVGGIPLKIPIAEQPPFQSKNVWLCKGAGSTCTQAQSILNQSCNSVGEQQTFTTSCGCQCVTKTDPVTLYARVVPVVKEGSSHRCVMAPSKPVKITMLPYDVINTEDLDNQKKLDAQIAQQEKAVYDAEKSQAKSKSPVQVEVLSYVAGQPLAEPPGDSLTMGSPRIYDTTGLQYQSSLGGEKSPFNQIQAWLSGKKTNYMFQGCAYDVDQLSAAAKQLSAWWKMSHSADAEQFMEALLDGTSDAYAGVQQQFAALVAFGMERAGVKCESQCQQAIVIGVQAALASQGIPPNIPSAEQLYDRGVEYVAMIAAQQAVGMGLDTFPEIANIPLAQTAGEKLIYTTLEAKLKSFNPFRNDGIYLEGEPYPHYTDNPYTWGNLDPYRTPGPATVWLRILPQDVDGYLAKFNGSSMPTININVRSKTGTWKDQVIPIYLKTLPQTVDPSSGKSTYKEFTIPVVLEPNINLNDPAVDCGGGTGVCKDVNKARAIWASTKYQAGKAANDIEVSSGYRWTTEPTYSVPYLMSIVWADLDSAIGTTKAYSNIKQFKNQMYYGELPRPPACDAFYWNDQNQLKLKENK